MKKDFKYISEDFDCDEQNALVVRVPAEIQTEKQVFDFFYQALMLPGYFGFNWNALFDCLMDLHWIDKRGVFLVHDDLPALPHSELKIYLEILRDAMLGWKEGDEHFLEIIFAARDRAHIESALESSLS